MFNLCGKQNLKKIQVDKIVLFELYWTIRDSKQSYCQIVYVMLTRINRLIIFSCCRRGVLHLLGSVSCAKANRHIRV